MQHGLGFDSRGDLIDIIEHEDATGEMPLAIGEDSGWIDVASGRWRHRTELLHARLKPLRVLNDCFGEGVALVDDMAVALSFERRRSRNFLVLTCIRKLASNACDIFRGETQALLQ